MASSFFRTFFSNFQFFKKNQILQAGLLKTDETDRINFFDFHENRPVLQSMIGAAPAGL
jgi:hypothetical protein